MPPPSTPPTSSSNNPSPPPSHFAHRVAALAAAEAHLTCYLQTLFHRPLHVHIHYIKFSTRTLIHETSLIRSNPPHHLHPPNQLYLLTRAITHCINFLTRLPIPPSTNVAPPLFHHRAFAPVAAHTIRAVSAFAHFRDPALVPRILRAFAHFTIAAATFPPRYYWSQSMHVAAPSVAPALLVTLQIATPAQRALVADAISPLLSLICHFLQREPCLAEGEPPVAARLEAGEKFVSAIGMVLYALPPVERRGAFTERLVRLREAVVDAVGVEAQLCCDLDAVLQRVEDLDG